jgi:hypothetical protein
LKAAYIRQIATKLEYEKEPPVFNRSNVHWQQQKSSKKAKAVLRQQSREEKKKPKGKGGKWRFLGGKEWLVTGDLSRRVGGI